MKKLKERWREIVYRAVTAIAEKSGFETGELAPEKIITEVPPDMRMGEIAFPMFQFSRLLKSAPNVIAEECLSEIEKLSSKGELDLNELGLPTVKGPYLNIKLNRESVTAKTIDAVSSEGSEYGKSDILSGKRIMIEFSCPNTNKPLHLGHLRNDAIGFSVANLLVASGATVKRVNLINDRGIHICKSMAAYERFGKGSTPESEGIKGDHFVGKYYVMFNEWVSKDPEAEAIAREMLKKWENGDEKTIALWKKMNRWAIEGISRTYEKTGIGFDKIYYESETYKLGKDEVLKGLEGGIFYKEEDGSVWVDLTEEGLDRKVLLRSDGTSLYLTQDIGTAVQRYRDWPFDRLIYVVASEQNYHFKVLFLVLKKLGHQWAENLFHLSYGMVNLPEGKMKSREGKVVDADDLFEELKLLAREEIGSKEREGEIEDAEKTAEKIALGALNYYLLQVSPQKDMVFSPEESISFTGNTGPYLQYTGARISSMITKYRERESRYRGGQFKAELLGEEAEWEIIRRIASYPEIVEQAAENYNPSILAVYLYELCKAYSRYYHDFPVLHNDDINLVASRIKLASVLLIVLRNGMGILGIPFLEKM